MAASCSCAAATVLSALAVSQLICRVTVLRISLSTLAVITARAVVGAPMAVKKSAIASACLKYSSALPARSVSRGEKPISSSRLCASRLTLRCAVASSRW